MKGIKKKRWDGKHFEKNAIKYKNLIDLMHKDIFKSLSVEDVQAINTDNLLVIPPIHIAGLLSKFIRNSLQEMIEDSEKKSIEIPEIIFCSFCYASALNLYATKKKGRGKLLEKEINKEIINMAFAVFGKMFPPFQEKFERERKILMRLGLKLYTQLYKVPEEVPFNVSDPSTSQVMTAIRLGEIVYGEKNILNKNLKLYIMYLSINNIFSEYFKRLFIIESDDIPPGEHHAHLFLFAVLLE